MSSEKHKQNKERTQKTSLLTSRSGSSTAGVITWGFWWRKLLNYFFFDFLLLTNIILILLYCYNQNMPQGTFKMVFFPTQPNSISFICNQTAGGLADIKYIVSSSTSGEKIFNLGIDIIQLWPLYLSILIWELIDILHFFSDLRRVRRALLPLNNLALKAEELGSVDILTKHSSTTDTILANDTKIKSLEHAIEETNIDSPQIQTGDKDLASIEIALNKLLKRMQEAKLQQMRFVNDASHELRTPIAVIQGYTDMLDRWGKTDRAVLDESISALKSESEHMHELVEQLLFLARGDAGRNTLTKTQLNIAQLTSEVWEESEMIDKNHQYKLNCDLQALSDYHYQILGDTAMLKQSLRIIVQNAVRYSPDHSTITFDVTQNNKNVQVSIEDEGIGIPEKAASHIFERFWRADNARNTNNEGSGLGLSIAKWIIDSHNGTIDVISHEGVGTRFTVTIPRVSQP